MLGHHRRSSGGRQVYTVVIPNVGREFRLRDDGVAVAIHVTEARAEVVVARRFVLLDEAVMVDVQHLEGTLVAIARALVVVGSCIRRGVPGESREREAGGA